MSKHSNPVIFDAVVGEAGVWIVHQDLQKTLIGSRDDAVEPEAKPFNMLYYMIVLTISDLK